MSKKIDRNKQHTRSKCWIRKLSELTFNLDCNFYNWLINFLECWKDNILCKQSLASYLIREIINLKYCCWESSHICKGKDRNRDTNAIYWSARKEAFFCGFNMARKAINFHYVKFAFSFSMNLSNEYENLCFCNSILYFWDKAYGLLRQ